MKIAISVLGNVFEDDGTTVRPKRVSKLIKNYYSTCFITRTDENIKELDEVKINAIGPLNTNLWNLKLIPVILKNRFDLIYCSNDWFGFFTYYIFSIFFNYKIIFEAHSILSEEMKEKDLNKLKVMFFETLERFVIRNADYIIALSENTYDFYKNHNKKIDLIPVFIDESQFHKKSKLNNDKKIIGLIGPFEEYIFNEYFLDFVYENIGKFDDKIEFKIIGKCKNKIINERIFYTGYIEDVNEYISEISSLDAVVIPSKVATSGPLNKIIEPMACSLPVFTTPKGVVGLYKAENCNNILIFNEDELVDGINELIFNDELMERIGINARITVENYYSKNVNKEKILKILDHMIKE